MANRQDVGDAVGAAGGEDFFPDDALPIHHLDDDIGCRQRGVCPHSGSTRTAGGGCPRGCAGATEHYSNDGHRACYDPPVLRRPTRGGR